MNHTETSAMETIGLLEDLARTLREDVLGLRAAADIVEREQAAGMLEEFAGRRAEFVEELLAMVENLGGEPADMALDEEVEGRGWLEHEPVGGGTDEEILEACVRGTAETVATYQEALETSHLPDDVADRIEDHLVELESSLERMRGVELLVERESGQQ